MNRHDEGLCRTRRIVLDRVLEQHLQAQLRHAGVQAILGDVDIDPQPLPEPQPDQIQIVVQQSELFAKGDHFARPVLEHMAIDGGEFAYVGRCGFGVAMHEARERVEAVEEESGLTCARSISSRNSAFSLRKRSSSATE